MQLKYISIINIVLAVGLLTFTSCGCPEEEVSPEDDCVIADDFSVVDTWFFQQVSGVGNILGQDRSDTDDMPEGFIRFNADSTGLADFSIDLLDMPLIQTDSFRWSMPNESTIILDRFQVSRVDTWTLCRANENIVESSWFIEIAGNTATITSILTP